MSLKSAGYTHVWGKKQKWSGNSFLNLFRWMPSILFLQILYIPRKWFAFYQQARLLRNSAFVPESAQNMSQLLGSLYHFSYSVILGSIFSAYRSGLFSLLLMAIPSYSNFSYLSLSYASSIASCSKVALSMTLFLQSTILHPISSTATILNISY